MRNIMRMAERNSRKIIQRLQKEGWTLIRTSGSHHQFSKDGLTLTVPHPKKDLPTGTARAIARAAGWLKETDE
ncbi:MAG: type II toxin-antitoxin system HicA family toxin [Hyphomonas sp.]